MKRASFIAGALAVLLWLTFRSDLLLMALKLVVDQFAIGHSGTKVRILLAALLLLALAQPFKSVWRDSWLKPFLLGLLSVHLICLGTHIYFSHDIGMSVFERSVALADGLWSGNRLQHIHCSKAVIANLSSYSGEGLDMGRPFLEPFSPIWWFFFTVLLLMVGLMAFALVHSYFRENPSPVALGLALVVFTLIKNSVDGGPLDSQTIAAIPLLGYYLNYRKKEAVILSTSLLLVSCCLSGTNYAGYDIWRFSTALISFSIPALWQKANDQPKFIGYTGLALVPLIAAPTSQYFGYFRSNRLPNTAQTLRYAFEPIKAGWEVTLVSAAGQQPNPHKLFASRKVIDGTRLRLNRVKLYEDTNPLELCQLENLNIFRRPVIWYQSPTFAVIGGPMPLPASKAWRSSPFVTRFLEEGDHRVTLELITGGNINVASDAFGTDFFGASHFGLFYENPQPEGEWRTVKP